MAMVTMDSSAPTLLYGIQHNDFLDQNYQVPCNGTLDMGLRESFYRAYLNEIHGSIFLSPHPFRYSNNPSDFYPPNLGLIPFKTNRVTYNGGLPPTLQSDNAVPHFQTQPSFTTVLGPTSGLLTSLQSTLTPSPASLRKKIQKAIPKSKEKGKRATRNATQSAKQELLISKPKRKRGPNKKRSETSFSYLLDKLPHEVRKALEEEYKGCCDSINAKDSSAKQKHWFTNRHCLNLPREYQEAVPNFVCPAFLVFNSKCRAKAGRHDSTERHCQNCAGFQEFRLDNPEACPVAITRSAYSDVQTARMALADNKEIGEATRLFVEAVRKMLAELFKGGLPVIDLDEGESNDFGAMVDQPTAQSPTMSEPEFEPESVDDTAQPTAQPPTTSAKPVFEPESVNGWDFDCLHWRASSESDASSGIVLDHTAPLPTTATLEPVFEPEVVDEWDSYASQVINESNDSGVIVEHAAQPTAQQPTMSEPMFEPEIVDKWHFDALMSQVISESDASSGIVDHIDHTPPPTATLEPVFESESVELGFDNGFFPDFLQG